MWRLLLMFMNVVCTVFLYCYTISFVDVLLGPDGDTQQSTSASTNRFYVCFSLKHLHGVAFNSSSVHTRPDLNPAVLGPGRLFAVCLRACFVSVSQKH